METNLENLKPGTWVILKTFKELQAEYGYDDSYNKITLPTMFPFLGKVVTISEVCPSKDLKYTIYQDKGAYFWPPETIKMVLTEEQLKIVKVLYE